MLCMVLKKIPSYILVRSGVYYVRIAVPPELRPHLGKNELKRSLNTRSQAEAARLAPATIAHFQRQLEAARAQCTPVHTTVAQVPIDQARQAATARLERMQLLPDRSRAQGRQLLPGSGGAIRARRLAENRALLDFYEEITESDQWDSWRVALGRATVNSYEADHRVRVAPGSDAHAILSEFGARAEIEHVRRAIHRDEVPHSLAAAPNTSALFSRGERSMSLQKLLAAFRSAKQGRWKPASSRAYVKVEKLLIAWFGAERPVAELTREDWRELFNQLPNVPVGYSRQRVFANMTLRQVIELADEMDEPPLRLTEKSCSDYAIQINSLLNWAEKEEILSKNPAKGLVPPRARLGDARRHFEVTELNQLFGVGHYSPTEREEVPAGLYWLPLVALFTGMRSGEIASLRTTDIRDVDGVSCFRLSDPTKLKTDHSVRDVPIHPELGRLGFMQFVRDCRRDGQTDLFPDIRQNGKKDRSSEFSRSFRKVLTRAALTEPGLSMHSFRHTFTHELVRLQVPFAVGDALQGWGRAKTGNMFAHYGGRPPISQLAKTMARVSYPGLDLSHLHTCSTTNPIQSSSRRQFD
jgi:integrase